MRPELRGGRPSRVLPFTQRSWRRGRYAERLGDEGLIGAILTSPDNVPFRDWIRRIEVSASVAAVASSEVRRRIRSGRSVADLVPPEVLPLVRS